MSKKAELLIQKIKECAEKGLTRDEAAKVLGLSYSHVASIANSNAINFRRKKDASPSQARNSEICRLYLAGERQCDLAEKFGLTRERIRQIIERAGIVSERKRLEDFMAVVAGTVARKGLTTDEATKMFGISRASAYMYCRRHGVQLARITADEAAEFEALAAEVENGKSITSVAKRDHAKVERLRLYMIKNGITARGRSRHADFSERRVLITEWRNSGMTWEECAQALARHDRRPIGSQAVYAWCRRHMPELFSVVAA